MFLDFFIALFGGLHYGGRALSEKANKTLCESRERIYTTYRNLIVNPQKELGLEREFRNNRLEIIKELSNELSYIIGEDYLSKYEKCVFHKYSLLPTPSDSIGTIWNLAYMIFLAKNGIVKLSFCDWFYTTHWIEGLYGDRNYILNDDESKEQRLVALRFGEVLEYFLTQKVSGDTVKLFFDSHYANKQEILRFGYSFDRVSKKKGKSLLSYFGEQ